MRTRRIAPVIVLLVAGAGIPATPGPTGFAEAILAFQEPVAAPTVPASQPPAPPGARGGAPGDPQRPTGRRASVPQPQQKQGIEYFMGTWNLEWIGRESPLSSGPRTGVVTFARQGTSHVLNVTSEGKTDAGNAYKETGTFTWDPDKKTMVIKERLSAGVDVGGTANWSSPLGMMFETEPIKVGGQTLKLRRSYQILSPQSFETVEEISVNGGRYQRLGNGEFTRKPS